MWGELGQCKHMEMFLETGNSLVWCCFCPFTHTHIHRKMVWLHSIIKRCVLCGACCLSTSLRDHLTSFEAILVFFLFFMIAPEQMLVGGSHPSSQPLQRSVQEELHPRHRGAVWHCSPMVTCQESCRAESLAQAVLGTQGVTTECCHIPL